MTPDLFSDQTALVERTPTHRVTGRTLEVTGLTVVAEGLPVPVGSLCVIERGAGGPITAQVVGARGHRAILMTLEEPLGVRVGDPVTSAPGLQYVPVGRQMLGSVLDGMGRPIGGKRSFVVETHYPVFADAPPPLARKPIERVLATGVRAIDARIPSSSWPRQPTPPRWTTSR